MHTFTKRLLACYANISELILHDNELWLCTMDNGLYFVSICDVIISGGVCIACTLVNDFYFVSSLR